LSAELTKTHSFRLLFLAILPTGSVLHYYIVPIYYIAIYHYLLLIFFIKFFNSYYGFRAVQVCYRQRYAPLHEMDETWNCREIRR